MIVQSEISDKRKAILKSTLELIKDQWISWNPYQFNR